LQPRIRIELDDTGTQDGWPRALSAAADAGSPDRSAAAVVPQARHGAGDREELPRSPETIPITLEAMTYGRHAADEGWAAAPSSAAPMTRGQARWRAAGTWARRVQNRLIGRSG
jgi:hypothetical protein